MFTSIGESKIPLGLLIFSSILNILMDLWMVAGLGWACSVRLLQPLLHREFPQCFRF